MYLIDTSIFSYLFRNDPVCSLYADELAKDAHMFISVQTLGELLDGTARNHWGESRRQKLMEFVRTFALLPISEKTASCYGQILPGSRKLGRRLDTADAWIVAHAKEYGLTLVTHDADMAVAREFGIQVVCHR